MRGLYAGHEHNAAGLGDVPRDSTPYLSQRIGIGLGFIGFHRFGLKLAGGPVRCGAGPPSHISRPVSRVLCGARREPDA